MTPPEFVGYVRRIDDALLPATRHTTDYALRERGCGRTSEGRRMVALFARVLDEAMRQRPEIANVKVNALASFPLAALAVLDDMTDYYRSARTLTGPRRRTA